MKISHSLIDIVLVGLEAYNVLVIVYERGSLPDSKQLPSYFWIEEIFQSLDGQARVLTHDLQLDHGISDTNKKSKYSRTSMAQTMMARLPWLFQLVGWLFWAYRPFETVFQSISGRLPERGRKKEK